MRQAARQVVGSVDGFALGKTHLIIDRDTNYFGRRSTLPVSNPSHARLAFLNATRMLKDSFAQSKGSI
jgi:hypothetical protein